LTAYFNTLLDSHYSSLTWSDENERWRIAREEDTIDDEVEMFSAAKIKRLKREWSPAYSNDDLLFLDTYYNEILATQNVSTPILKQRARDLCELTLRVKKGTPRRSRR
jgi:hypothetical protein